VCLRKPDFFVTKRIHIMAKKPRIDSAAEQVKVMAAATKHITSPSSVPLEAKDQVFFQNVIDEFSRSEWTAHQLELAAMLARTMADLVDEQIAFRTEGSICYTDKGTPVINPRKTAIQMHASTIMSMRRSLSLHARAQGGDQRDIAKRRSMAKQIEGDNPLDDDLLARPH
jgi:hypothetical protein